MFGLKVGELTVIGKEPEYPKKDQGYMHKHWKVKCSCGREKLIYESNLRNNKVKTCGNCNGNKDIKVGDVFDKLTVVSEWVKVGKKGGYYCKCSCGNPEEKHVTTWYLKSDYENKGCGKCARFDIVGQKFGRWTVNNYFDKSNTGRDKYFKCTCDCGTRRNVLKSLLLSGASKSCGCLAREISSKVHSHELTGQKFGKLTVIKRAGTDKGKNVIWECKCECGNTKNIMGASLLKKNRPTKSCGCLVHYDHKTAETIKRNTDKKHIGVKRGRLTPLKRVKKDSGQDGYECECDCGKKLIVGRQSITSMKVTSCGCEYEDTYLEKLNDTYRGKQYGRLTIQKIIKQDEKFLAECFCSCGQLTTTVFQYIKSGKTRSCGCLFSELRGENHPCWNPELTDEERAKRPFRTNHPLYRRWRKKVFARDDYTCQKCGEKGGELHAHHIIPWNSCEETRYEVDNGATLCEDCHRVFHKIYSYSDASKEDFEDFILIELYPYCGVYIVEEMYF